MTREYRQLHKFCLTGGQMGRLLHALWIAGDPAFGNDCAAKDLYQELDAIPHSFAAGRGKDRTHGYMLSGVQVGAALAALAWYNTKPLSKRSPNHVPPRVLLNAPIVWVGRNNA